MLFLPPLPLPLPLPTVEHTVALLYPSSSPIPFTFHHRTVYLCSFTDPFTEVATGCAGMLHVASPVTLAAVANPYESVVAPAITGTLSAAKAAQVTKYL